MRSLDAICETFAPGAVEQGVPDAVLDAIEHDLTKRERQRLLLLLRTWLPGYLRLSQSRREAVLRLWRDSPVPVLRTGFQALRKAALAFAYLLPGRWEEIGYPGPPGAREDAPAPRLEPIEVGGGLELDCDVCVIGSGAGGGVAAAVLAQAGVDVVVLEAGGYWSERDFDGAERSGLRRLYRGGGASATDDQGVALIAGACLGGGTVVNYTTSFRTPDDVLEEWEGLGFPSAELGPSLDAVCERLGVNTDHNRPSRRDEAMARGLESLGWHVEAMPRDVLGCEQGVVCGSCGYGCPIGAKQSTDANVARGRRSRRSADRGRRKGPPRARRERQGRRRRCGACAGAVPRGRRGRRGDRDACVAAPLRPPEPECRPRAAAASGDGGLRDLRRGDPTVGGDATGALLRPVPLPRRRLRRQVRDRAVAPRAPDRGAALGGGRRARRG